MDMKPTNGELVSKLTLNVQDLTSALMDLTAKTDIIIIIDLTPFIFIEFFTF